MRDVAGMPRKPSPAPPRLYLLGPFRLEIEGVPVRLSTRKVESLLAYLVLHPQAHSREKLAALFWGDSTDAQARDSLRTALKNLRKQLSDDLLLADRETVQLNPEYVLWVDAREFLIADFGFRSEEQHPAIRPSVAGHQPPAISQLQTAIDLYRGDLLADYYDDWVVPERERYRTLYLDSLLRLAQEGRTRGECERAIEWAKKVLALDGANELAHRHLMFCYLELGDRVAALKQYDQCVRVLRAELDVEPSAETTALYRQIKESGSGQKTAAVRLTNLPIPLTSFVGRQRETIEIKDILAHRRLLTLTGAGGSGKTRLAIQVANDLLEEFQDGVWWVELAPVIDAALVPTAVAKALGVREVPNQPLRETLANYLHSKNVLLVLDNCEHLIEACAQLAWNLLGACADLTVLATSREALGVTGEQVWQVPTMSLPDSHQLPLPQLLARYEGIQLFVERARAVKSGFELTARNAFAVGQVCRRLDGIPLAIELAAARVRVLSPEELAARLDDRFGLLTGGSRTALPRHQTLRAAIDWSHDLLSEHERVLFRRLSVFAGGFTLDAATAVCSGHELEGARILDLVSHLVDKSLIKPDVRDQPGAETRYRILETIREYAREKLVEAEEYAWARDSHLRFFSELAQRAEPMLLTEQVSWFNRLDAEMDNLRAAIEWSMRRSEEGIGDKAELGLVLAGALTWFLESRARSETSAQLKQILSTAGAKVETTARAKGLGALGHLEWSLGNLREAQEALEAALALGRKLGDRVTIAWVLPFLGGVADFQGDYATARAFLEEAIAISPDLGVVGKNVRGVALGFLGDLPMHDGDFNRAQALYEASIGLLRDVRSKNFLTYPLRRSGYAALHQGNSVKAVALFKECLEMNQELGHQQGVTRCIAALAAAIAANGNRARAMELFGAVDSSLTALDSAMFYPDQFEYQQNLAAVRSELDEGTSDAAWAEGHAMTIEQAIDHALESTAKEP